MLCQRKTVCCANKAQDFNLLPLCFKVLLFSRDVKGLVASVILVHRGKTGNDLLKFDIWLCIKGVKLHVGAMVATERLRGDHKNCDRSARVLQVSDR